MLRLQCIQDNHCWPSTQAALAANPKKNEIYVANTESNNISVIDAEKTR